MRGLTGCSGRRCAPPLMLSVMRTLEPRGAFTKTGMGNHPLLRFRFSGTGTSSAPSERSLGDHAK
jgi:hypothetical protein